MQKFLFRNFIPTASIANAFIFLSLQHQGVQPALKDFQQWEHKNLPLLATKTKGGLKKAFVQSPALVPHVDQFDISGAYACAMIHIKFPLFKPIVIGGKTINLHQWAEVLNGSRVEYDLINFQYKLPEKTSEWERSLVIYDSDHEVGNGWSTRFHDVWNFDSSYHSSPLRNSNSFRVYLAGRNDRIKNLPWKFLERLSNSSKRI